MLPLLLIVTAPPVERAELISPPVASGIKTYSLEILDCAFDIPSQWEFDGLLIDAEGRLETVLQSLPEIWRRLKGPIIVLSTEEGERLQIEALRNGATEIITKVATARFVAAKVHGLLDMAARAGSSEVSGSKVVKLGLLSIDPRRANALVGENLLEFTGSEFHVLLLLASQPGEFFHRRSFPKVNGRGDTNRSADMHIGRFRKKLRDAGVHTLHIDTPYGLGYRFSIGRAPEQKAGVHDQRPARSTSATGFRQLAFGDV